jgi:hypothetical protein
MRGEFTAEPTEKKTCLTSPKFAAITMFLAVLAHPNFAAASLGGTASTVESDRARMQAEFRVERKDAYSVHELRALNGVVVKEFISPNGIVFGVAWQGPSRPDLQQLLGGYFAQFRQAAKTQRETSSVRRMLRIEQPGLVLHSGGHARAFVGHAYVPELLPPGVHAEEIR